MQSTRKAWPGRSPKRGSCHPQHIIEEDDRPSFKFTKSESSRCFTAGSYIEASISQLSRPQQTMAAPCGSQIAPPSNKLINCLATFVVTRSVAQAAGSAGVPPILSQTPSYNISYPKFVNTIGLPSYEPSKSRHAKKGGHANQFNFD